MAYARDPEELQALVIQAHPSTRTIYEVARQLRELLPIESAEDFAERARLSVAGEELSVQELTHKLPTALFPVHDQADLVRKVAEVVRVAAQISRGQMRTPASGALAALAMELAAEGTPPRVALVTGLDGPPLLASLHAEGA